MRARVPFWLSASGPANSVAVTPSLNDSESQMKAAASGMGAPQHQHGGAPAANEPAAGAPAPHPPTANPPAAKPMDPSKPMPEPTTPVPSEGRHD